MFWKTASAVPSYHCSSEMRWLAGRMSKLSLRSRRRNVPAALQVTDQAVRLVLGGDPDPADAGVERVGEREVDDPGGSAEMDRGLGPPVGELLQPGAPPARQHERHRVSGKNSLSPPW